MSDNRSERLKQNGEINKALLKLINDYMCGKVSMAQIRKFVAKNEMNFAKLVKFFENESNKISKSSQKVGKEFSRAGKKKTPDQKNSKGYTINKL